MFGGDLTTTLDFTIDGVAGSVTPSLTEGTQVVDLGTVDATVDGQASVSIAGFPGTPVTSWSAPAECSSPPPTATADPTDSGSAIPPLS